PLDLHSFPTRRSSDLFCQPLGNSVPMRSVYVAAVLELAVHLAHTQPQGANPRQPTPVHIRVGVRGLRLVRRQLPPQDLEQRIVRSEEHTSELQSLAYL